MQEINDAKTFISSKSQLAKASSRDVRLDEGVIVESYADLLRRVARLSFRNPQYVLFFRGQAKEYKRGGLTTLFPRMFRGKDEDLAENISRRYEELKLATASLARKYRHEERKRVTRHHIMMWAILQHYEVCDTPLLDITHSLSVACSFAFHENTEPFPVLYVLAIPHLSGGVAVCSESGLQIVRLLSVCPHIALRPHAQEAYVIGEYPTIDSAQNKTNYRLYEVDFANRLLCKFRLNREQFEKDSSFASLREFHKELLFPKEKDEFLETSEEIKRLLS